MLRKEEFFFSFGLYQLLLLETYPRAGRALGASFRDPPGPGRAADASLLTHLSTTFLCLGPSPGLSSYTSFKLTSEDRDRSRTTEMRKLQATKRKKIIIKCKQQLIFKLRLPAWSFMRR